MGSCDLSTLPTGEGLLLIKVELQVGEALSKQHLLSVFLKQRHEDISTGAVSGYRSLQLAPEVHPANICRVWDLSDDSAT